MIDTKELRRLAQAAIAKMSASDPEFASSTPPLAILALLDRLEAAEKDVALKERVIDALGSELNAVANERDALHTALEKIADWDSAWGPYPETNEAWRAMAIVTAREAVPRRGE